ncbi:16308_t:CDS:1, partial [Racocetra persica]
PKTKTLKRTIKCYKKLQTSQDAAEVFRMTVQLAYFLDTLANKTPYFPEEAAKRK